MPGNISGSRRQVVLLGLLLITAFLHAGATLHAQTFVKSGDERILVLMCAVHEGLSNVLQLLVYPGIHDIYYRLSRKTWFLASQRARNQVFNTLAHLPSMLHHQPETFDGVHYILNGVGCGKFIKRSQTFFLTFPEFECLRVLSIGIG